ncbi:hypothetical protein SAMN05421665_1233 [Yoonia rosea]|uniref:Uncharacterized protein n=1 Tax=Yoonia rosea TaxID=287098 RepID=A0A1R3WTB3_9RHOB|nr:hypothetical protein [Yoonia rosea]SIT81205.1 hypothetical protein SAMN05421665_1233 [Yoonia rosea]
MPITPRAQRTCLCCNVTFEGTPAATRCKPCRAAGIKVPAKVRAKRDNRKPRRMCLECRKQFTLEDDTHVNCPSCAEMLGVFQYEMTPEQQAAMVEAENLQKHKERLQRQNEWLTRRENRPKGYPRMNQKTSTTPLGILWLGLCAADGAAGSVMYAAHSDVPFSEEDKATLMLTFYRLRAKGYHPSALAKLCPRAILQQAAQDALQDLPKVTAPEPYTMQGWGDIAARASLGLQ